MLPMTVSKSVLDLFFFPDASLSPRPSPHAAHYMNMICVLISMKVTMSHDGCLIRCDLYFNLLARITLSSNTSRTLLTYSRLGLDFARSPRVSRRCAGPTHQPPKTTTTTTTQRRMMQPSDFPCLSLIGAFLECNLPVSPLRFQDTKRLGIPVDFVSTYGNFDIDFDQVSHVPQLATPRALAHGLVFVVSTYWIPTIQY